MRLIEPFRKLEPSSASRPCGVEDSPGSHNVANEIPTPWCFEEPHQDTSQSSHLICIYFPAIAEIDTRQPSGDGKAYHQQNH
jgi:hypothetical protein